MIDFLLQNKALVDMAIAFFGMAGAIGAVFYAALQLRASKRSIQGEFLFRFDEMLEKHNEIHKRLRPGGDLASGVPITANDWPHIETYMGLFERIKILIDDGFIDVDTFDRLYGYRVDNITRNEEIKREKLVLRAHGWKDFNALVNALEHHRKRMKDQEKQSENA